MMSFLMADKPWDKEIKTVGGKAMVLVAIQENRRVKGKKKTIYIYNCNGTEHIYYTTARNGVVFRPIVNDLHDMKRQYEIFVEEPLTRKEHEWLALNDYQLVK